ncbi:MAG TPA: c-type cytochrome [Anaerolineales bacterium]|nr:c-type cytochrome [Anaerolineales bacterium]
MSRSEFLSRILVIAAVVGVVGAPFVFWKRTPLIHAKIAEDGGWSPDTIHANVGEPLHLRFTSDDVVHGFGIGQMDMQSVDIMPGKVTDLTLTFDKPGNYTFFCTRWCGLSHWRMRGTIEVTGDSDIILAGDSPEPAPPPLYVSLNLDIDAPHDSPIIPSRQPLVVNGQLLAERNSIILSHEDYLTKSPFEVFDSLSGTSFTYEQRWDIVAYLWHSNTTPGSFANGKELYAQNCAACHGENGEGDGVFADDLAFAGEASMQSMTGAHDMVMQTPPDFTDPKRMLGTSPALLQGKVLRGGMGTGMPMWGVIFTEEQIWDLIAYIYSFQFDYQGVAQ